MAALGFCLEHCPRFKERFFNAICRQDGDPENDCVQVKVEPADWADLLITNIAAGKRYIYVIECKIGALLKPHQNPAMQAFWLSKENGYGEKLRVYDKEGHLRFCVLGYPGRIEPISDLRQPQVIAFQRSWADVEKCWPETRDEGKDWQESLVNDLFESLGSLHIRNFRHRSTNNMKVKGRLDDAARAFCILEGTADILDFVKKKWVWDNSWPEDDEWYVGIQVNRLTPKTPKDRSANHLKLQEIVKSGGPALAWFGYEANNGRQNLAVWFYSENKEAAKKLTERLKTTFKQETMMQCGKKDGADWFDVIVRTEHHTFRGDRDWFKEVFRVAGLIASD